MIAIEVNNLTKIYRLYNSPKDRLREMISLTGRKFHNEFYALNDVSFSIAKGQTVGIIGQNGSGKSTLLKIICGVLQPSGGGVKVNGRISSLLELGAGFNPEFTGRENVYMNGALMGFSRGEMEHRFSAIEEFADIGEFIDQPVKSYSSGMLVRVAFAAAINIDPEILVVDEALSVGDMFFRAKCMTKMNKMIEDGVTLIFVTHDMGTVKSLCNKCIWISHGKLLDYDDSDKVVQEYQNIQIESQQETQSSHIVVKGALESEENLSGNNQHQIFSDNSEFQKKAAFQRIQNGKANFVNIQLLNEQGETITLVDYEQLVTLRMAIEVNEDIPMLTYAYHVRDKNGVDIIYSDSLIERQNLYSLKKDDKYIVEWKFKISLRDGCYNIACVLSIPVNISIGRVDFCDFIPHAIQFITAPRKESRLYGFVHWENKVEINKLEIGVINADASHRLR